MHTVRNVQNFAANAQRNAAKCLRNKALKGGSFAADNPLVRVATEGVCHFVDQQKTETNFLLIIVNKVWM
jgi:hypothetical protein